MYILHFSAWLLSCEGRYDTSYVMYVYLPIFMDHTWDRDNNVI